MATTEFITEPLTLHSELNTRIENINNHLIHLSVKDLKIIEQIAKMLANK